MPLPFLSLPPRSKRSGNRAFAIPLRALWQRFAFLILAALAGWLLVLGMIQPQMLAPARIKIVDSFSPLLDAMTRPADALRDLSESVSDWMDAHDEVVRLRAENARLKSWEQAGAGLAAENRALKQLLNFHDEPVAGALSARVIAVSGGPFTHAMIVTAGARDGVRPGMAAMTADGLIGRVVEVGDWSARILLITDLNSRIPVMVQDSGERAILAGDNQARPTLLYLPEGAVVADGARLVTSGHGDIFPPHLPVGIVAEHSRTRTTVVPVADLGRVHYVQLIDFNLAGGAANTIARELRKKP
ncbi:MAG: rod shape-determining protein MreC [Alphaproteobacteria bacterium]